MSRDADSQDPTSRGLAVVNSPPQPQAGESVDSPGGATDRASGGRLFGFIRRNRTTLLVLIVVSVLVVQCKRSADDDYVQRVRTSVAIMHAAGIRDAVHAHAVNTGKIPTDLAPFVDGKSRVSSTSINDNGPDIKVSFRVRGLEKRIEITFDPDQGPLSGKTMMVGFDSDVEPRSWRCWSLDLDRRYLPARCR